MARTPCTLTLQAKGAIAASEADIHGALPLEGVDFVTLFVDYTKGDETGLYIRWYYYPDLTGSGYLARKWSFAGNDWTGVEQRIYLTASGRYEFLIDIRGRLNMKFTQQANGGTPTGTAGFKVSMTQNGAPQF